MRKKWLSELYAYSVAQEKSTLSPYLIGWRKAWIDDKLMPIFNAVIQDALITESTDEKQ